MTYKKTGEIASKRFLLALMMIVSSVSWAEWIAVRENEQGIQLVDYSSLKTKGSIASMWTMSNFKQVQKTDFGNYRSIKVLSYFDCIDNTLGDQTVVMYSKLNGSGVVVFSADRKKDQIEFTSVVPETMGEAKWKIACGKK